MHCAPCNPITWGNRKHQMSGRLKVLLFHLAQFYLFPKFHIPLCFNAFHNDLIRVPYTVPKRASHEAVFSSHSNTFLSDLPNLIRHCLLYPLTNQSPFLMHLQQHTTASFQRNELPCRATSSSYQPATQELVEHKWGHSTALASSGEPLTGPHVKPGSNCSLLHYPQHISVCISSATPSTLPLPNS